MTVCRYCRRGSPAFHLGIHGEVRGKPCPLVERELRKSYDCPWCERQKRPGQPVCNSCERELDRQDAQPVSDQEQARIDRSLTSRVFESSSTHTFDCPCSACEDDRRRALRASGFRVAGLGPKNEEQLARDLGDF